MAVTQVEVTAPSPTTRVLVVGLGSIGRRHARLLSTRPDVELLVCDPVADHREAARAWCRHEFTAYEQALAARPDIVVVCTPNPLHVPMGRAALAAGADLLVEKPLSDTLNTARELVDEAGRQQRLLHVGYMLRWDLGLRRLKEIVEQGGIGQPVGGRAMVGTYITLLSAKTTYRGCDANGLVLDYTHLIDYTRWFFGEVKQVAATSATIGNRALRPEPNVFQMLLTMRSGALVQIHLDYVQHPERHTFEIHGDSGTLHYDFLTGEIRHYPDGREHRWNSLDVEPFHTRRDDLFLTEHEHVIAARRGGLVPLVSGSDGIAALEVAEAAIAAAAAGQTSVI